MFANIREAGKRIEYEWPIRIARPNRTSIRFRFVSTQRASPGCPQMLLYETNTARRETPGRRNTKAPKPQHEEKATHTRRNRHDRNRKQDLANSGGCGKSSCEVSSDLARPGSHQGRGARASLPPQVRVGSRNYLDIPTSGPSSCDDGELFSMPPRIRR